MLNKKPVGIFHLLDDESNFPKVSIQAFEHLTFKHLNIQALKHSAFKM